MTEPTRMWAAYTYQGQRVIVVQQWRDPYGRRMVRVQLADDEDHAMGLPESDFLHDAKDATP